MNVMSILFELFYNKLPNTIDDVLPVSQGCKLVTCLNPYYLIKINESDYSMYEEFDYICSDGIGPILLNKIWRRPKSLRLSFDMSGQKGNSLAKCVFEDCVNSGSGIYVLGAYQEEVEKFVENLMTNFLGIKISGFHNGYISDCYNEVLNEIISSGASVVVIGMGAPLQDEVAIELKKRGFLGSIYTCGGFIHQSTTRLGYYPQWIDKFNLRAFYRIFHEKGMLYRLLNTYPSFLWNYSVFLIRRRRNH